LRPFLKALENLSRDAIGNTHFNLDWLRFRLGAIFGIVLGREHINRAGELTFSPRFTPLTAFAARPTPLPTLTEAARTASATTAGSTSTATGSTSTAARSASAPLTKASARTGFASSPLTLPRELTGGGVCGTCGDLKGPEPQRRIRNFHNAIALGDDDRNIGRHAWQKL
jgi:hypothetical protein